MTHNVRIRIRQETELKFQREPNRWSKDNHTPTHTSRQYHTHAP